MELWSGKILAEHPGPQSFTSKGTQLPGRKAETLVHPVTLPTKALLHSEGDKDVERKGMMFLRPVRNQGVRVAVRQGLTSGWMTRIWTVPLEKPSQIPRVAMQLGHFLEGSD